MSLDDLNYEEIKGWLKEYSQSDSNATKQQLSNMIVFTCQSLVKKIVYSLARRCSDPIEDLLQVGNLGLIRAIHKYNPSFENPKTYLSYSIMWELKHHLRNTALQEGATYATIELAIRADKFDIKEIDNIPDTPMNGNSSSSSKKIIERRHIVSLDELQFTDENNMNTLVDKISDEKEDYEKELNENKIIIDKAVKQLPDKLQEVVHHLYYEGGSQIELARKWNTPQSSISRMQKRALNLLTEIIKAETKRKL